MTGISVSFLALRTGRDNVPLTEEEDTLRRPCLSLGTIDDCSQAAGSDGGQELSLRSGHPSPTKSVW